MDKDKLEEELAEAESDLVTVLDDLTKNGNTMTGVLGGVRDARRDFWEVRAEVFAAIADDLPGVDSSDIKSADDLREAVFATLRALSLEAVLKMNIETLVDLVSGKLTGKFEQRWLGKSEQGDKWNRCLSEAS